MPDKEGKGWQGQLGNAGAAGGLADRKAQAGRDSREMLEQQVAWQTGKPQAGRDSREMLEQQVTWQTEKRHRQTGIAGKCRSSRWLGLEDREGKGWQGQ